MLRFVVFGVGAAVGAALALLVFSSCRRDLVKKVAVVSSSPYESWFSNQPYKRRRITPDEQRYGANDVRTEADVLRATLSVACCVNSANATAAHAKAINATWGRSCDKLLYYNGARNPHNKARSSFHALCEAVRKAADADVEWALFVRDEMFVVPENLRKAVAHLDPAGDHYLGHTVNFWGVDYNAALGGFALSRGAMRAFAERFDDADSCIAGGKYWKQEDLYMGKHLKSMGISPVDLRDEKGNTLFLGYDLDKVMFPNSIQEFSNFYTRALHPVKCCGNMTISFQVLSSTEIYRYFYMVYTLRIFSEGSNGNRPAPLLMPEDDVWKNFLEEKGISNNVSAREYEKMWYLMFENTTLFPEMRIRPGKS